MTRLMTFVAATTIAAITINPPDYKHPFAAANKKKDKKEFVSGGVQDYKHPNRKQKETKRVFVSDGNGANSAASTKHPFGL